MVMDRQEYIKKARALLEDITTYSLFPSDPTNKHKNRLINILKNMKAELGMSKNTYKMMYPYRGQCTKVLWAAQDTQERCPPEAYCV